MASTSPEPPSTPEESGPLTPPLSPSSTEILETAAQHALNSEDPSFLIAVLNELDLPVLTYRSRMIMNHLIQYHPIPLCHRLSKIIFSPRDTITKVTSAVALELFKSFFSDDSWGEFIKPLLLDLKRDDYAVEIIPIINELVSHFNPHYIPENDWLGFTTAVCDNLDSDKEEVLEFVLSVINRLFIDGAEKILELSLETLCDKLKKILRSSDVSLKVKESAVEASFGCILRLKNAVNDKFLQDLLRKVMNTVFFNGEIKFDMSQEGYARLILDQLVALARTDAWFLRNQVDKVLEFTFIIMENPQCEERTRFLAIEFVLVLVEDKKGCQILVNTGGLHIKRMLSQLLCMIATINENVALENRDERDQEQWRLLDQVMKSMARFSQALGGRFLLEGFPQPFESCFNSEAWQRRHAAVTSLSIISKNCSKTLKSKVDLVANPVMKMVDDMHHHVRWRALYAVEEFSKYLHPELQNHYNQKVLPALTKAMDDFSDSKIQVQAAMATYHFVEYCTSNMLQPHLDEIISKLLRCLQKGKQLLKLWALSALAAIAKSSQDRFLEYYRTVMPYLKVVMTKAQGESNSKLLSATVSCITAIWTVFGEDKFGDDTQQVVQLLVSTPISNLEIHDPMRIEGLRAWGRLCKCLGHKFQPYMEVAIPCLLQSARLTLPDDANVEESDERNRMIQIKTETLEEKATACVLLRDCVAELKEGIDLWIDEVAETLVPLLNFYEHPAVRIAAVLAMPEILKSSKAAIEKRLLQKSPFEKLCSDIIPALVEALVKEEVIKISAVMLDSLEDCLELSGPVLNIDQIKRFLSVIMDVLDTSMSIPKGDEASEQGEKVSQKVCACLKIFMKTYKGSLLQFFDQLLSPMEHMWVKGKTVEERKIALKIFTDVVEEFREEALKFCESELLLLFKACNDDEPEVQEVAAHGIGVAAAFGGSIFKPLVGEAVSALNANISDSLAMHRDYIMAHDAAVTALGQIYLFHKDRINASEVHCYS
ncbi:importin-5-like isoform X1 [Populus alba x Populus x berolinensis]|uniref:Importin-5-like isoform X1 n=1 Tax=Populus alba x Populus x berolinensis TaxID=444605 RepID=A0AAD6QI26_9ROSI|nr:importin-5-like isoform X1 [Populus alba x Populus x berolinensis]